MSTKVRKDHRVSLASQMIGAFSFNWPKSQKGVNPHESEAGNPFLAKLRARDALRSSLWSSQYTSDLLVSKTRARNHSSLHTAMSMFRQRLMRQYPAHTLTSGNLAIRSTIIQASYTHISDPPRKKYCWSHEVGALTPTPIPTRCMPEETMPIELLRLTLPVPSQWSFPPFFQSKKLPILR